MLSVEKSRLLATAVILISAAPALQATELSEIVVVPGAGQTQDQARRDRYECHNWAVGQTGSAPPGGSVSEAVADDRRANRIEKVITGAAVGAAAGSIIRGSRDYRDANDGALAGGVLGAIAGAVIGGKQQKESEDESFDSYFRALSACMNGRGYSVSAPGK